MSVTDPPRAPDAATRTRLDIPRARQALVELQAAQAGPRPQLGRALECARPVVAAFGDALARAEFTLVEARMQAPRDAMARVIADLRFAVQVFQVNQRDAEEAAAWCALAAWLNQTGRDAAARQCAQRALAIERLAPELRLGMMEPMLPLLAQESGVQVAWQTYDRLFEPYMAAAPSGPARARAHLALANLHVLAAIERAGLRGRTTLRLRDAHHRLGAPSESLAESLAEVRRHVAAAAACGHPPVTRMADALLAAVSALEGRVDDALQAYGDTPLTGLAEGMRRHHRGWALRINGHWPQALAEVVQALDVARGFEADSLELATRIECAICREELGDAASAARDWAAALTLLARARAMPPADSADVAGVAPTPRDTPGVVRLRRAEPPCVAKALRRMREHLAPRLSIAALARECDVSPRTLQGAFRDYRGSTVVASYRQLALQHGRDLLVATTRPIKEIAADCGYGSSATFTRDFTAGYGLPPAAFRRHAARRGGDDAD